MSAAVEYERRLERDWTPPKKIASIGLHGHPNSRALYHEAIFEARQRDLIDNGGMLLFTFLASMHNNNMEIEQGLYPTHKYIAQNLSKTSGGTYSVRWVSQKLRQGRAAGLIDWHHRFLPRRGEARPTSNVYALRLPEWFVEQVKERQAKARKDRATKKVAEKQSAMATPKGRVNARPDAGFLNAIFKSAENLEDALADLDPDDDEARLLMAELFQQHYDQLE